MQYQSKLFTYRIKRDLAEMSKNSLLDRSIPHLWSLRQNIHSSKAIGLSSGCVKKHSQTGAMLRVMVSRKNLVRKRKPEDKN